MRKMIIVGIVCSIVLLSVPVTAYDRSNIFSERKIRIENFRIPEEINLEEEFEISIELPKLKLFLFIRIGVRIDLLDENYNVIRKGTFKDITEQVRDDILLFQPRYSLASQETEVSVKHIIINKEDISLQPKKYYLRAVLFVYIPIMGWRECYSMTVPIDILWRMWEKDKVRITHMDIPEEIKKEDFQVTITVKNEGDIEQYAWVRIDLIETPSMFPGLEELNIEGFSSVRKELGRSKIEEKIEKGDTKPFTITCHLRETEIKKENFNMEAVLFLNIDGRHFKVDTSTLQGIYHEQKDNNLLLIIGAIFAVLIAILLIALIIRLLYPLYHGKVNEKEKE